MIGDLKANFTELFGDQATPRTFFAPGRVNLIGEHTDYNGGHVFPCALEFGTYAIGRKREDRLVRVYSRNFPDLGVIEFSLDELIFCEADDWANYPKGVIATFIQDGQPIDSGLEILYYGNIPNGAGLSSSASIELATAVLLRGLFNLELEMLQMVQCCQQAENQFIGVNCGIMDQFAIGMGKQDAAILLDCKTLAYRYSKIDLQDAVLIIANTNKRRGLADSKYNERRLECERALAQLQTRLSISTLGDLTISEFEEKKELITNPVDQRRAKHAVYENQRTLQAVQALEAGDLTLFGQLMKESHLSLKHDYQVTGVELDTLVELAWNQEGTIGSRMTGAGFGGCTVNIVHKDQVSEFIEKVGQEYNRQIGYEASFYVTKIGNGAREIN